MLVISLRVLSLPLHVAALFVLPSNALLRQALSLSWGVLLRFVWLTLPCESFKLIIHR